MRRAKWRPAPLCTFALGSVYSWQIRAWRNLSMMDPLLRLNLQPSEGQQERSHILWSPQLRCPGGHGHMKKLCSQGRHSLVLSRAQKICKCVSKGTTLSSAVKVRPTRSRGEGSGAPPLTPKNSIVGCACCAFHRCQGQNVQA